MGKFKKGFFLFLMFFEKSLYTWKPKRIVDSMPKQELCACVCVCAYLLNIAATPEVHSDASLPQHRWKLTNLMFSKHMQTTNTGPYYSNLESPSKHLHQFNSPQQTTYMVLNKYKLVKLLSYWANPFLETGAHSVGKLKERVWRLASQPIYTNNHVC